MRPYHLSYLFICATCVCSFFVQPACQSTVKQDEPVEQTRTSTQDPEFSLEYLRGLFDPSVYLDFTLIDSIYADRSGMYLRTDAYKAFLAMHAEAAKEDIILQIRSAARNFQYQKDIWERKWTGETKIENDTDASLAYPDPVDRARAILRYSSMPGTSRHHWGTDLDLNSFENSWFESGDGLALYTWMISNASRFGYCQPYTQKGVQRPGGYEEEKWHWSYIPVASILTDLARSELVDTMIAGFMGAETASEIQVVETFVLGINPVCFDRD